MPKKAFVLMRVRDDDSLEVLAVVTDEARAVGWFHREGGSEVKVVDLDPEELPSWTD